MKIKKSTIFRIVLFFLPLLCFGQEHKNEFSVGLLNSTGINRKNSNEYLENGIYLNKGYIFTFSREIYHLENIKLKLMTCISNMSLFYEYDTLNNNILRMKEGYYSIPFGVIFGEALDYGEYGIFFGSDFSFLFSQKFKLLNNSDLPAAYKHETKFGDKIDLCIKFAFIYDLFISQKKSSAIGAFISTSLMVSNLNKEDYIISYTKGFINTGIRYKYKF